MDSYKAASYNVRKAMKEAKQRYERKLESQLQQSDSWSLWQRLRTITDYKAPTSGMSNADASLADELNTFYARFKAATNDANTKANAIANGCRQEENANTGNALIISKHDVRRAFRRMNTRKAAGPDGISGSDYDKNIEATVLNPKIISVQDIICDPTELDQATDYFESVFHNILDTAAPLKRKIIKEKKLAPCIWIPQDPMPGYCLWTLVLLLIRLSQALLRDKLFQLNVPDSMCSWITDFLTDRQQFVRLGMHVSDLQHISTGSPQGCVLSPLLFSLYTNSCTSGHQSVKLLKFADDTTLIGLISDGDESAYRGEMDRLVSWCSMNNLELNCLKTVEMMVDFRKDPAPLPPVILCDSPVTSVESFHFLGTTIT
ncbi:hypothetical protein QTP70_004624 [Hemibagrus guttatus]|uniref:Reverse transcriptase domain-containing protein n=1 Tax=Hemibagrus guttatus TaxID=175788 RepID=A0AAE0Q2B3_9TELE|nr:hypothetical protein QTP70_004624 [Hemibagrus guttatus]KAK3536295.1 hypothetical protein QTP86_001398 [Hemibagrus guttatus]